MKRSIHWSWNFIFMWWEILQKMFFSHVQSLYVFVVLQSVIHVPPIHVWMMVSVMLLPTQLAPITHANVRAVSLVPTVKSVRCDLIRGFSQSRENEISLELFVVLKVLQFWVFGPNFEIWSRILETSIFLS